jgi:ATP-dependent DNA helicase DinG
MIRRPPRYTLCVVGRQRHMLIRDRLTYSNTAEKLELLDQLENKPSDSVLVGPSLFTGIDLSDDKGRFNIITKLAFPNVGSPLWARRFKFARDVYFGETASVLEQSAGRTTRHADDYSTTYILDSRAKDFLKYSRRYLSDTFMDRLV